MAVCLYSAGTLQSCKSLIIGPDIGLLPAVVRLMQCKITTNIQNLGKLK